MTKVVVALLALLSLFAFATCGALGEGSDDSDAATSASSMMGMEFAESTDSSTMTMMAAAAPAPEPFGEGAKAAVDGGAPTSSIDAQFDAGRMIISTGAITMEVDAPTDAAKRVEAIATSLGGYVEQSFTTGSGDYGGASLTIRVPQDQFTTALARIRALGDVVREQLNSDDVSEQFVDMRARLKSAKAEETAFLSLLRRTDTVSEVISIERELARIRSDIEGWQGRLNFLERQVSLSTITVDLQKDEGPYREPPSAFLHITVDDVSGGVETIRSIISSYNGEIDRGTLIDNDGRMRANLTARVFYADFRDVVDALERMGSVNKKTVAEPVLEEGESGPEKDPAARLELHLEEPDYTGLLTGGAVAVLVLALVAALVAWRVRARRRRAAAGA